jgi:hypothetical protein
MYDPFGNIQYRNLNMRLSTHAKQIYYQRRYYPPYHGKLYKRIASAR